MPDALGVDGLSERKRKFLEIYKGFNFNPSKRTEALKASGYVASYASQQGAKIERSVKPFIVRAMKKAGIGPTRLAGKLNQLLDCEDSPGTQIRALDMGLRLLDAYPNPKITSTKVEQRRVRTDYDTLRLAEEVTGEHIIDPLPENVGDDNDDLAPL